MGDSHSQPLVPEINQSVTEGVSSRPEQDNGVHPMVGKRPKDESTVRPLPARRYWSRYLIHLTIGFIIGLLIGSVIQLYVDMPGWSVVGAVAGFMGGIVVFMLRRDT